MDMEFSNETLAEAFKASGLTQQQFCDKHEIKLERLRYYLYKKVKKSNRAHSKQREQSASPAFISFDKISSPQDCNISNKSACTIIHGNFSIEDLASFISVLGQKC
jgi:hypothetical protein